MEGPIFWIATISFFVKAGASDFKYSPDLEDRGYATRSYLGMLLTTRLQAYGIKIWEFNRGDMPVMKAVDNDFGISGA